MGKKKKKHQDVVQVELVDNGKEPVSSDVKTFTIKHSPFQDAPLKTVAEKMDSFSRYASNTQPNTGLKSKRKNVNMDTIRVATLASINGSLHEHEMDRISKEKRRHRIITIVTIIMLVAVAALCALYMLAPQFLPYELLRFTQTPIICGAVIAGLFMILIVNLILSHKHQKMRIK